MNIELKTKAVITVETKKINKERITESIEEYRDRKIEKYDAMLYDGEINMTRRKCENCGSVDKVKVGKDSEGKQRWLCRKCEQAGRTPKYQ